MDPTLFKDVTTSRGLKYHYFFSAAAEGKPTLLFCHGFPSMAADWRRIVPHFVAKGYGVVAPDMLGYGGTDKPTDPAMYVPSAISRDLVDILDAEGLEKVIAIGHDWGSKAISRLSNYYPERVIAYAFLSVPYIAKMPPVDMPTVLAQSKKDVGYELFGYWLFFSEDDADEIIQAHIDSFVSIMFPYDPTYWKEHLAPSGTLRKSLLEDFRAPLPPYFSEEDKQLFVETFRKGGFTAPTCWYKIMTQQLQQQDDSNIPNERAFPPVTAPIFYGAAKHDYISLAARGHATFAKPEFKDHKLTIREYDSDHWLILSHADEVARDLEAWVEDILKTKALL